MNILVQKFGGTSVKNRETRLNAINHVRDGLKENKKVVVVVSAMGREPDPYSTDALLKLAGFPASSLGRREQDLLLSCGEVISAVVFSSELKQNGISAVALTGAQAGFITTEDFTEAKIKEVQVERLYQELSLHDVVVVAGFQGRTESGETTTIGRGGSDTSAAALGAALQAEYIDIFTDVEGIMTADPRVAEKARILDVVTYNEICNMAYQGASVIHPRAVEIAMQAKVPVRVRSVFSKNKGTLVTASREAKSGKDIPDRLITGIAHKAAITQIQIQAGAPPHRLHGQVFKAMAEEGISIDFINISPDGVTYTIPDIFSEQAAEVVRKLGYQPRLIQNCAKVSLVGAGMTGVPGVTAKIVDSLINAGIPILQSADSHTTIWVLIREKDLHAAVNALHAEFELERAR